MASELNVKVGQVWEMDMRAILQYNVSAVVERTTKTTAMLRSRGGGLIMARKNKSGLSGWKLIKDVPNAQ